MSDRGILRRESAGLSVFLQRILQKFTLKKSHTNRKNLILPKGNFTDTETLVFCARHILASYCPVKIYRRITDITRHLDEEEIRR
jgi:hypothetical protein